MKERPENGMIKKKPEEGQEPWLEDLQEGDEIKRVAQSRSEQAYIVRARFLNSAGRLFGGDLLAWIDETGALAAKRHCNQAVTTVAIDNIHFVKPMYEGQVAVLIAKVTYVGNSSIEVRVHSYVEDIMGVRSLVNSAYLVYVALENEQPVRVPRLEPVTEGERAEWIAGKKRAAMRRRRREEGF